MVRISSNPPDFNPTPSYGVGGTSSDFSLKSKKTSDVNLGTNIDDFKGPKGKEAMKKLIDYYNKISSLKMPLTTEQLAKIRTDLFDLLDAVGDALDEVDDKKQPYLTSWQRIQIENFVIKPIRQSINDITTYINEGTGSGSTHKYPNILGEIQLNLMINLAEMGLLPK